MKHIKAEENLITPRAWYNVVDKLDNGETVILVGEGGLVYSRVHPGSGAHKFLSSTNDMVDTDENEESGPIGWSLATIKEENISSDIMIYNHKY